MNEYEQQEIEKFFKHGEFMIADYQELHEHESIEDYDVIICTENGTIAFLVQSKNLMYEMGYHDGFSVMQYCTDNNNKWTSKVIWLSGDYWRTIRDGYTRIEEYD